MMALIYSWGPGSNWQEWDQLELVTRLSPDTDDSGWGQGQDGILMPGIQITVAGSWAIPAGFSLPVSVQSCQALGKMHVPLWQNVLAATRREKRGSQGSCSRLSQPTYDCTREAHALTPKHPRLQTHEGPHFRCCKTAVGPERPSCCLWDEAPVTVGEEISFVVQEALVEGLGPIH